MPYGSGHAVRQAMTYAKPWQRYVIAVAMIVGGVGLAAFGRLSGVVLAALGVLLLMADAPVPLPVTPTNSAFWGYRGKQAATIRPCDCESPKKSGLTRRRAPTSVMRNLDMTASDEMRSRFLAGPAIDSLGGRSLLLRPRAAPSAAAPLPSPWPPRRYRRALGSEIVRYAASSLMRFRQSRRVPRHSRPIHSPPPRPPPFPCRCCAPNRPRGGSSVRRFRARRRGVRIRSARLAAGR